MLYILEKAGLKRASEKTDALGFSKDFYKFLGIGSKGRDYQWQMSQHVGSQYNTLRQDFREDAAPNFYTPIDDFYSSTGDGSDTVSNFGRVPVSHLMALADQRLGILFRGCNGTANDIFRNRFDFVSYDNLDKVVERPEVLKWMRRSYFWDQVVYWLDFCFRSGLGHLVSHWNGEGIKNMHLQSPKTRPDFFEVFSAYYLTPINIHETALLDYQKQKWNFIGGLVSPRQIHHSRINVLETHRVEFGLRGRALAELCWVPLMCYLNTSYYILKSLSQLGTVTAGINIDKEYPSTAEVNAYLEVWNAMQANQCFVLGRNAQLSIQNAAGQIGSGINSYLEFLIEDISSAWIIPKNQLLGRSDGGGLDGAGALISKEDYLASNLSTRQIQVTNDLMHIFQDVCHFPNMENLTLRWNIDLHKTEEQRLTEQMMREQLEVAKIGTEQAKLGHKLYKNQVKLQTKMSEVQLEMMEKDPKAFMEQSQEDEENLEEGEQEEIKRTKDFMEFNYLNAKYNKLMKMYKQNQRLLTGLYMQRKMLQNNNNI
jgi:hypothetical protein